MAIYEEIYTKRDKKSQKNLLAFYVNYFYNKTVVWVIVVGNGAVSHGKGEDIHDRRVSAFS